MKLKSLLRRVVAALGIPLLLGSVPAEARTPLVAHPALWEVSDPDTTIYLFGTIHLLPSDLQWRTPKLDQAMANSQQLVVETIVDDKNPTKLMSALASLGLAKGLPPLVERVPAAKRPALEAAIKKSGVPEQAYNGMKTWMAAFLLLGGQFRALGLSGGVEGVLRNSFTTQGKPVGELETNLEQLSFFDRLPESAQQNLLEGAIEDSKDTNKEYDGMLDAWSRGDVGGIARTFDHDLSDSPVLQQTLIRQRNANWSKWIEQRMAEPGTVLLAVGAGHLAGKNSVIEMLQKDGYKVRRLQ
ncbi:MAG: TraB/GumN family protein [Sphingomicrobium sp.]